MKRTGYLFLLMAVLMASFSSCKKDITTKELTNALPKTSAFVIQLDVKSLLNKSEFKPAENAIIAEALENAKANDSQAAMIKTVESLIKDPNSSGVSVLDDAFLYIDGKVYGALLKVNDKNKLKETLVKGFDVPESLLLEQDGIVSIDVEETTNVSWSENALLLLGKQSRYDDANLKELAVKQLKQGAKESINENKTFGEFLSNKKDISVFYSYENFYPFIKEHGGAGFSGNPIMALYDEMFKKFSGISVGGFVSFEKGEILVEQKYLYRDAEAKKMLENIYDKMYNDINGAHLGYIAENPLMAFSTGIKGAGVYDYIAELGLLNDYEGIANQGLSSMGTNLKELISNLEGDFSFAIHSMPEQQGYVNIPNFSAFIDTKDIDKMWPLIKTSLGGMAQELKTDNYLFDMGGVKMYFGAKDKTLFFTTVEDVYKNIDGSKSVGNLKAKAKGETVFLSGNLAPLTPFLLKEMSYATAIEKDFMSKGLALIGDITFVVDKKGGKGVVKITKNDKNSLAVITQYVTDLTSSLNR